MIPLEPVPLEAIDLAQIETLLAEEIDAYRDWYRWDFSATAQLVRQLVSAHSLGGIALVKPDQSVVGYSYFVIDEQKAVLGDVYLSEAWASPENEHLLITSTLGEILRFPQVRRLESQPMMLRYAYSHPRAQRHERLFLELDLAQARWPATIPSSHGLNFTSWDWHLELDAAQLIYRAYRGHLDADINDQYQGPARARIYLSNMLRYPSCGHFSSEATFLLTDPVQGRVLGLVLSSISQSGGDKVGHVSQLCIDPDWRGRGLGRLLLLAALARFTDYNCAAATLSVTAANRGAHQLYQSVGFAERTRLSAYVWPSWPA